MQSDGIAKPEATEEVIATITGGLLDVAVVQNLLSQLVADTFEAHIQAPWMAADIVG